ncbi:hypothetical protein R7R25_17045 [Vibrio sp. 2026]|uniref:hypothetical protein n=1 Tax=Vibrio TaxID=662 RepID=UPI0004D96D0D|nr:MULTISPECIES: hypothetical protein [Vibrio]HAS8144892.1 hypothetical protein [Vibrio vulnificus]ANQ25810.1 hypothetical protein BA894_04830 [Vibrio natriegens]EIQ1512884.1 hypothetical protein [Vibrio parahaemolyticus]EJT1885992.1 hypothetical protein [Vibrio parahaemolyticus]EKA3119247.1 hypothetical protein [Vibrio alginolyticus]
MTTEDNKEPTASLAPFKKPKRRRVIELTQCPNVNGEDVLLVAERSMSYSVSSTEEAHQKEEIVPILFKTTIVDRLMKNEQLVEQIKNNSDDRVQQGIYSELLEKAIIESLDEHQEIAMELLLESNSAKQFSISVFAEIKHQVLCTLDGDRAMAEGKDKNDNRR